MTYESALEQARDLGGRFAKIAVRGDPFLNKWKQVFHTDMGPSRVELAVSRAKSKQMAAPTVTGQLQQAAAAMHPEGSAQRSMLRAGWDPKYVNHPGFDQSLHASLGAHGSPAHVPPQLGALEKARRAHAAAALQPRYLPFDAFPPSAPRPAMPAAAPAAPAAARSGAA